MFIFQFSIVYLVEMTESSKKTGPSAKSKAAAAGRAADIEAILEQQRDYLDTRFNQLQEMGKDTEGKLDTIQMELVTLRESIGTVNKDIGKLRSKVTENKAVLSRHESVLEQLERKLAEMEDRSRRCNVRIVGLVEGAEGSNAVHFLTQSLPKWFPSLKDCPLEIMRAHRIRPRDEANRQGPRTLIFNVLRFTTCERILRAAKKKTVTIGGKSIRLSPDYSNYTLKRRHAFSHAMDMARAKGVFFSLRYPATLRVKVGGQTEFFESPADAESFVNMQPAIIMPPSTEVEEQQDDATGTQEES